ncbi:MAG: hypothetical protein GXO30_07080 [Epsilonproteobacteria bacterium]|nr:hypothetical protein [Campylobacterota bacterium]
MRFFIKIILLTLLVGITLFAKSVATVTALSGSAYLQRDAKKSELNLGDKLLQKDIIITNAKAKVQIIFEDETVVTIGRNSEFSIDEYLFEDSNEPVAKFGMFRGAMRAITGKIGKIAPDKFKVKTKTATIGIRGTNFTIVNSDDGSSAIYCTYGAISVSLNGIENIVKQGFYLYLSPAGKGEIKAFSAKELSRMKKKRFGKNKKSNKDSKLLLKNEQQIDTTKDFFSTGMIVKDISDKTQDAAQTATKSDFRILTGYATGDVVLNPDNYVKFIKEYENFDPEKSYILLNNLPNANEKMDSWRLFLASKPISYTSKESFKIGFSSAEVFPGDTDSTTRDPYIRSGVIEATNDDLKAGDYMTWGTWNVEIEYKYDDYDGESSATHYVDGLWIAGEPTTNSVIEGMEGESSYVGIYRAKDMLNNEIINGKATMHVDFGDDSANLHIDYDSGRDFDMTLNENSMHGSQSDGVDETGNANGTFYGPMASEVGGNFYTTHKGEDELQGIYQLQVETN